MRSMIPGVMRPMTTTLTVGTGSLRDDDGAGAGAGTTTLDDGATGAFTIDATTVGRIATSSARGDDVAQPTRALSVAAASVDVGTNASERGCISAGTMGKRAHMPSRPCSIAYAMASRE